MGRIIPYIMENKKCSKPPTSHTIWDKICGSIYGMNDLSIFLFLGGVLR